MNSGVVNRKSTGCLRRLLFHLLVLLVLAGALWGAAAFILRRHEAELLYHPLPEIRHTPHEFGLDFQRVEFRSTDNVALSGWWVAAPRPRGTVVFFQDSSGNMGHVVKWAPWFQKRNLNVFFWDPRGFGQSAGKPSERGFQRDAEAALDVVRQMNRRLASPLPVILYGHSLGAALALHAASVHPDGIAGLVLEAPFSSVDALVGLDFPALPVHWFVSQHYDAASMPAVRSSIPKLVGHSPDDERIPYALGVQFVRHCAPPARFVPLSGRHDDHAWFLGDSPAAEPLNAFLEEALAAR